MAFPAPIHARLLSFFAFVAPLAMSSGIDGMSPRTSAEQSETRQFASDDAATAAIKNLIAQYVTSVDQADPALASQVWSHSPDVTFIHPHGHEHGLDQIQQNVYTHLMGELFSERQLNVHDISVHVYGDTAWAEFYWDFAAKLKNGSPITTRGRETQIYRKESSGWRLVHVHYSAMPAN
ncbi:MAG: hypothetical protein NVS9B4_13780 [Candidatus Acidiferrum sp.]